MDFDAAVERIRSGTGPVYAVRSRMHGSHEIGADLFLMALTRDEDAPDAPEDAITVSFMGGNFGEALVEEGCEELDEADEGELRDLSWRPTAYSYFPKWDIREAMRELRWGTPRF